MNNFCAFVKTYKAIWARTIVHIALNVTLCHVGWGSRAHTEGLVSSRVWNEKEGSGRGQKAEGALW